MTGAVIISKMTYWGRAGLCCGASVVILLFLSTRSLPQSKTGFRQQSFPMKGND